MDGTFLAGDEIDFVTVREVVKSSPAFQHSLEHRTVADPKPFD